VTVAFGKHGGRRRPMSEIPDYIKAQGIFARR